MNRIPLWVCLMGNAAGAAAAAAGAPAGLQASRQAEGVRFEYRPPAVGLVPGDGVGLVPFNRYRIDVPGLSMAGDPGVPALPGKGIFVALPPGARPRLKLEEAAFHEVKDVWIDPARTTRIWPDDGDTGETGREPEFAAVPDPEIYATDAFVPSTPVAMDEPGVARDVDFVQVQVRPFAWNPVRGVLKVYDRLVFRVDFDPVAKTGRTDGAAAGYEAVGTRHRVPGAGGPGGVGPGGVGDVSSPSSVATGALAAAQGDGFFVNGPVPAEWHHRPEIKALASAAAPLNPAANGEAYKLEVSAPGIHRVTHAALAAVGFPAAPVPFTDLKLELRGQQVQFGAVDADRDGLFGPGDAIEFYGVANPDQWSRTHLYWLTRNGGGVLMRSLAAMPPGAGAFPAATSGLATLHIEQDENYFAQTAVDPLIWDPWTYDFRVLSSDNCALPGVTGMDVAFDLKRVAPAVAGRTYQLRGQVLGRKIGTCNPDSQQVDFSVNTAAAGSVSWLVSVDGMLKSFALPLDVSRLVEGQNHIGLIQPILPGKLRWVHLDYLDLDYERRLVAEDGVLDFRGSWSGGATFYAGGFATGLVTALDLRSDGRVDRLEGVRLMSPGPGQPSTLSFALAPESNLTHHLVISERARLLTPRVSRDAPSDLGAAATAGEYLVITHAAFKTAVQELADYRASTGLSVQVVDVQDVYDEFSWGNVDPRGIRDFLAAALARWSEPPLYVLLVGDSTQDFKDRWTPGVSPLFIPHFEMVAIGGSSFYGELLATDSLYQTLVGSDTVPDLLLGRLAVQTPLEVSNYIAKLRAYEASPATAWKEGSLLILDDNIDQANCTSPSQAEENAVAMMECYLASGGPNPDLHVVTARAAGLDTNNQVVAQRNQGVSLSLYLGHGSSEGFGQVCISPFPTILGNNDLPRLNNPEAFPLEVSISCNTGAFSWDDRATGRSRCMGESFVVRGGNPNIDIGFISSTAGISEVDGRGQLEGILDGLFRDGSGFLPPFLADHRRSGAIHFAGQVGLMRNPRVFDLLVREWTGRTLALAGDPAAVLQIAAPPSPPRATCP